MKAICTKILMLFILASAALTVSAQVTLTATSGTATGSYTTLSDAFGHINDGTHKGAIVISINASTTEPSGKSDTLYSTGIGSASYTSVYISPTAANLTISGNPVTGRGVIELFGADNVTIDGHWSGSNNAASRDLTVVATTSVITTFCSVIRLANSTSNANFASCDNNTIKNCILNGNVYGTPGVATASNAGDTSTITTTATSTNSSFGIVVGYASSTASVSVIGALASTSPQMSSTIATGGTLPPTTNNLVITNNQINQTGRGIAYHGFGGNSSNSVSIKYNVVGSSTDISGYTIKKTGSPVQLSVIPRTVYVKGILVGGASNYYIDSNTVQNITSFIATAITGIDLLTINQANANGVYEVQGNTIKNIYLVGAASMFGINNNTASTSTAVVAINGNTITNVQCANGNTAVGIGLSSTYNGSSASNNKITRIWNVDSLGTSQAVGIQVATAAPACIIKNNFISNILTNLCSTSSNFSVSQAGGGIFGIQIGTSSNTGGSIYHNSIYLTGPHLGSSAVSFNHITAAIGLNGTLDVNFDIRNNILVNTISGGNTCAHVAIALPASGTTAMNLILNNNAYYCGSGTAQGIAQVGTTQGTGFYTAANFSAGPAAPGATNFRAYSKTLSAAATNDNASFVSTGAAPFVSATDLHISSSVASSASQLESGGATVGIATDIDGDTRPSTNVSNGGGIASDIGADEFDGVVLDLTPPSIAYTALGFDCDPSGASSRTFSGVIISDVSGVSASSLPRVYYKKGLNGTYSSAASSAGTKTAGTFYNGTWSFTIDYSGLGLTNGDSVYYFIVAQDAVGTPNVGTSPGGGVFTNVTTVSSYPSSASSNLYRTASLSGNYNIGTGFTAPGFTTIDAAIKAYNNSCISGAVTFSLVNSAYAITSDTIASNYTASATNTLTIKPTLANTLISGTPGASNAVFFFQGADYVTINGSIGSTTNSICAGTRASRDLTIKSNTAAFSSGNGAVIWLGTTPAATSGIGGTGTDGSTNNKIINCNITGVMSTGGNGGASQACGIGCGGPIVSIPANQSVGNFSPGNANNNNQYINDSISICSTGIYTIGGSVSNKNTGTVISQCVTGKTPNNCTRGGISANWEDGITISGNTINAINSTNFGGSSVAYYGIALGYGPYNSGITTAQTSGTLGNEVTNATVTKNIIDSNYQTIGQPTSGASAVVGIYVANGSTGTTTIANNRISNYGIYAGFSQSSDVNSGIHICGGAGTVNVYHNTINIVNGTSVTTTGYTGTESTYGVSIANNSPIVNLKNNIINVGASIWTNRNRCLGLGYALPATNLTSNNNDFYVTTGSGTSASTNAAAIAQVGSLTTSGGNPVLYTTLSSWQDISGKDANSKNVLPVYVSSTNLHLDANTNCTLSGAGAAGLVTDDIDCETRTQYDIGADEIHANPAISIASDVNNICANIQITITATTTNAGSSANYNFSVNGVSKQTGPSNVYSSYTFKNGDAVTCVITKSDACTRNATSTPVFLTIKETPESPLITGGAIQNCILNSSTPLYSNGWKGTWSSSNPAVASLATGPSGANSIKVTALSNGTSTISFTNSNTTTGCASIATTPYTVASVPVNAISSNSTACVNGQTFQATDSTPNGVWASENNRLSIDNNGVVTPSKSAGTGVISYTVTIPETGCYTKVTKSIVVSAQPAIPTVAVSPAIGNPNALCSGGAVYNFTGTPAGGTWASTNNLVASFVGSTMTTGNVTGVPATISYTVSSGGCTNNRSFTGRLITCFARAANTTEPVENTTIAIYPNPAKNYIVLQGKNIATVQIINSLGTIAVQKAIFGATTTTINIQGLGKGLYLVKTTNTNGTVKIDKLIVE